MGEQAKLAARRKRLVDYLPRCQECGRVIGLGDQLYLKIHGLGPPGRPRILDVCWHCADLYSQPSPRSR